MIISMFKCVISLVDADRLFVPTAQVESHNGEMS